MASWKHEYQSIVQTRYSRTPIDVVERPRSPSRSRGRTRQLDLEELKRGHTYDVRADLAAGNGVVDNHCGFGGWESGLVGDDGVYRYREPLSLSLHKHR